MSTTNLFPPDCIGVTKTKTGNCMMKGTVLHLCVPSVAQ